MKFLLKPLRTFWRLWFYISIGLAIIILLPFIFFTSVTSASYRQFFIFARAWAWIVLIFSGFWPSVIWHQRPEKKGVYIICANHTSMMDIMLTLAIFRNCFLFIGKKELTRIPLFGYFYRRTNLLVDRNSLSSKRDVMQRAGKKIKSGIGICIYPEGGVPDEEIILAPFKLGAFKLAVENGIPIIPVSYPDNKSLLPYNISKGRPGMARAVVHEFLIPQGNSEAEMKRLRDECYAVIESRLKNEQRQPEGVGENA